MCRGVMKEEVREDRSGLEAPGMQEEDGRAGTAHPGEENVQ